MSGPNRYVALALACAGFAITYSTVGYLPLPQLYYYPGERRWAFAHTSGIAMAWFGHALAAALIAIAVYAAARAWLRRAPATPRLAMAATWLLMMAYAGAIAVIGGTR